MRKTVITKGSELAFMDGTFTCREYDGTYVWGMFEDLDGSLMPNRRLTLPEIANYLWEVDGHNYKVYWEE